jgi:hypothetical protein
LKKLHLNLFLGPVLMALYGIVLVVSLLLALVVTWPVVIVMLVIDGLRVLKDGGLQALFDRPRPAKGAP